MIECACVRMSACVWEVFWLLALFFRIAGQTILCPNLETAQRESMKIAYPSSNSVSCRVLIVLCNTVNWPIPPAVHPMDFPHYPTAQ